MTVLQLITYLQNNNILGTDAVVVVDGAGNKQAIVSIIRTGGTTNVDPPNPPADVPPVVTIQLT